MLKLIAERVKLRVQAEIDISSLGARLPVLDDNTVDGPLLRAFAPLHRSALGIACGVVVGGLICAATLALVIHGGYPNVKLYLLDQFFWGYSVSWLGALIGFLWGWVVGFVLGYGFALVRNAAVWVWLTVIRSRAEMEQYSDFLDHL
jgi:hypothetical protein